MYLQAWITFYKTVDDGLVVSELEDVSEFADCPRRQWAKAAVFLTDLAFLKLVMEEVTDRAGRDLPELHTGRFKVPLDAPHPILIPFIYH